MSGVFFGSLTAGLSTIYVLTAQPAKAAEPMAPAIPLSPPGAACPRVAPVYSGALGQAIEEATAASGASGTANGGGGASALRYQTGADACAVADDDSRKIAQAVSQGAMSSESSPVDLAPVKLLERTAPVFQPSQFETGLLYKLPSRLFFYSSTENSLRLETNVLQTLHHNRADMIYRALPNVTVGYALTERTRVSANYFYLRDQYTRDNQLLSRNMNSIGFQIQHDIPLSERTNITTGFMSRQLLLSHSQPLSDLLPSVQITRRVGARGVVYGGVLGQIRFRNTIGRFQEGDQFYSFGGMYRTSRWYFLWDNTVVTNFGHRKLRYGPNNQNIIMTLEADYRISPRLPVVAFVRAQPIFNTGANEATGFAGVNFRIFGGLRLDLNKAPVFPVKLDRKK